MHHSRTCSSYRFYNFYKLYKPVSVSSDQLDDAAPKAFGFLLHGFPLARLDPLIKLVLEEVDCTSILAERNLALAGVAVESVFRLAGDLAY